MKLKVIIWQEEDVWCANVPALEGCHTWGDNYDHLMEMVKEAIEGWLEVANSMMIQWSEEDQLFLVTILEFIRDLHNIIKVAILRYTFRKYTNKNQEWKT